MSIAFGGAMKDSDEDSLKQALRAMRKINSKRKALVSIRALSKRRYIRAVVYAHLITVVIYQLIPL